MKIFKEFNAILNYFNCINRFLRLYANFYKKNLLTNAVNCKIIMCQTCYSHLNFYICTIYQVSLNYTVMLCRPLLITVYLWTSCSVKEHCIAVATYFPFLCLYKSTTDDKITILHLVRIHISIQINLLLHPLKKKYPFDICMQ